MIKSSLVFVFDNLAVFRKFIVISFICSNKTLSLISEKYLIKTHRNLGIPEKECYNRKVIDLIHNQQ